MILIGQYDSPFVRRVAIAMHRYEIGYEHRPWGVYSDGDSIAAYNPLRRVPTLVLDDGEVLIESSAILDFLDELVGEARALLPARGPARRDGLKIAALATGFADKSVSLYLETFFRTAPSELWITRCKTQIAETLDVLEADRARRSSAWWLEETPSHADIAVGCALRYLIEAHPKFFASARWPKLAEHSAKCDALPEFQAIYQPFQVSVRS